MTAAQEIPLLHVYTYNDVDRRFWEEHLADWLPDNFIDAHIHIVDPSFQVETVSEELKRSYWVMELLEMPSFETLDHCYRTVFPGKKVACVAFGFPSLGWEIEGSNAYVQREALARGWHSLALVRPTWVAEQVAHLLDQPGVIGVKPYYQMIGYDRTSRDSHIEASIFDFLPHHQLEVVNERGMWVTMHVPKAGRLGHPDNLREIAELRRRYPNIKLVIAHLGRSYTLPHAEEGLLPLIEDEGLYFDNSAVLNPAVHHLALEKIGPKRILYGSDNPIFFMRGRRQWEGRTYRNRTSHPFHFNKEREAPEIEANYTLYMYEALLGIKQACERLGIGREGVEDLFRNNAARLIADIEARKVGADGE